MTTLHNSTSHHRVQSKAKMLVGIGPNPLSQLITNNRYRYSFKCGVTISHFLYMDGIKLYAESVWASTY